MKSLLRKELLIFASLVSMFLAPSAVEAQTLRTAKSANAFIDSVGINTHFTYPDTPYLGQYAVAKQKLLDLKIRHIRDGVAKESYKHEPMNEICDTGIRLHTGSGERVKGYSGALAFDKIDYTLGVIKDFYLGCVESIEGPNEFDINNDGEEDWGNILRDYTETLYEKIKGDSDLRSLRLIAPSVAYYNVEPVGNIAEWVDFGNLHSYSGGKRPSDGLKANIDNTRVLNGTKPYYATEAGYHTAVNNDEEVSQGWAQRGVSELAAAKYIPRLYAEYFRKGIRRTYLYEFIDQFPNSNRDRQEQNFGILRNDMSNKPAYASLRNTMNLLNDTPRTKKNTGRIYDLVGDLTDIREVLLQKKDGSHYLLLWQEVNSYDYATKSDLNNVTRSLKLRLKNSANIQTYLPLNGTNYIDSYTNVKSANLKVPDHLLIVKVD